MISRTLSKTDGKKKRPVHKKRRRSVGRPRKQKRSIQKQKRRSVGRPKKQNRRSVGRPKKQRSSRKKRSYRKKLRGGGKNAPKEEGAPETSAGEEVEKVVEPEPEERDVLSSDELAELLRRADQVNLDTRSAARTTSEPDTFKPADTSTDADSPDSDIAEPLDTDTSPLLSKTAEPLDTDTAQKERQAGETAVKKPEEKEEERKRQEAQAAEDAAAKQKAEDEAAAKRKAEEAAAAAAKQAEQDAAAAKAKEEEQAPSRKEASELAHVARMEAARARGASGGAEFTPEDVEAVRSELAVDESGNQSPFSPPQVGEKQAGLQRIQREVQENMGVLVDEKIGKLNIRYFGEEETEKKITLLRVLASRAKDWQFHKSDFRPDGAALLPAELSGPGEIHNTLKKLPRPYQNILDICEEFNNNYRWLMSFAEECQAHDAVPGGDLMNPRLQEQHRESRQFRIVLACAVKFKPFNDLVNRNLYLLQKK